jgi:nitroreductase
MNETIINALSWRYAVQSFDTSKKVSEADLRTILESGRLSASSFGLEPWKFIVVENSELRTKLAAAGYGQAKITEASHLIVIARRTDTRENIVAERIARTATIQGVTESALDGFKQMLDGTVAGRDDAALDTWNRSQTYIALGSMMEAASLLKIDNAAMEGFDPKGVDEVLGLSAKHLTATTMLALGYRSEKDEAARRPKVRRDFDEVIEFIK